MADKDTSVAGAGHDATPAANTAAAVQKLVNEEHEKGYLGHIEDKTPRHNYTVAGVTAGLPTPEHPEPFEKK